MDLALSGGDDYQLAFPVSPEQRNALQAIAQDCNVTVKRIGRVVTQTNKKVRLFQAQQSYQLKRTGYQHFTD